MNHSASPYFPAIFFSLALGFLPISTTAKAEGAASDGVKISVKDSGWAKKGELVLGVQLGAGSKTLALGRVVMEGTSPRIVRFSMAGAKLQDAYTGQVIAALPSLPHPPYFGIMEGVVTLNPGEAIIFGVGFPHPPDPPKDKDGKQLDYKFKLQVPDQAPIDFSLPFVSPKH